MTVMIVAVDQLVLASDRRLERAVQDGGDRRGRRAEVVVAGDAEPLAAGDMARRLAPARGAGARLRTRGRPDVRGRAAVPAPGAATRCGALLRWALAVAMLGLVAWCAWSLATAAAATAAARPGERRRLAARRAGPSARPFLRTSAAILIGGAWALPVGMLIGLSPAWSQRLQPVVQVVASFPAPMVFPLVVLLITRCTCRSRSGAWR